MALPMIFLPLLMGQALAFGNGGQISVSMLSCALLFGVIYQVHLLYTNDHADEAIDRLNTEPWLSGGSRVLPQGKLRGEDLRSGARFALIGLVLLTLFLILVEHRPWMAVGTIAAVLLCWAYHRPPLQMSYRGHGETLQGLGCGVLLPLIGFYLQQGSLQQFPWSALLPLFLLFWAGNLVTALPDFHSDRIGRKLTYPVRHGERRARITALIVLACAYAITPLVVPSASMIQLAVIVVPPLLVLSGLVVSGLLEKANVSHFRSCKAFVSWVSASQAWVLCAWIAVRLLEQS